jgi:hypothetical protein
MNPETSAGPQPDSRTNALIDAALRRIGTTDPEPGIEGRILTRLAAERVSRDLPVSLLVRMRHVTRASAPVLYGCSVCLVAGIVVAGSISHSHRIRTNPLTGPPVLTLPTQGVGAASAVHPAAPASTPAPAGQPGRSTRTNRKGRARIAPHAHKAPGVALPAPPGSASQN